MWPDIAVMPHAAKKVLVSAEEIVDTELLREHPERTVLPGFVVNAVVEVPHGAHPTSLYPRYGYDSDFHALWVSVSRDDDAAAAFLDRHVRAPASQQEYLAAIGGQAAMDRIESAAND